MTIRTCTLYLTLSFGKGLLDEVSVEAEYEFDEGIRGERSARVDLYSIRTERGTDILADLPEGLQRKLAASILTDELTGVFS